MGRAYEVRKYSIQKTGAAKGKIYTTFAKEIYLVAKNNPDPDSNINLRRIIEKAKKQEVPNEIIKRAIEKAKGNTGEEYHEVIYEGFGPGASTIIVKCLTDNVNRTVSNIRLFFNKAGKGLGVTNSVRYNYENLGILSFKYAEEEKIFNALIEKGIEPIDFEYIDGEIILSLNPKDMNPTKDILEEIIPNINYLVDEIGMYALEKINLTGKDKEDFQNLYNMLDESEDVTAIYTNVNMDN